MRGDAAVNFEFASPTRVLFGEKRLLRSRRAGGEHGLTRARRGGARIAPRLWWSCCARVILRRRCCASRRADDFADRVRRRARAGRAVRCGGRARWRQRHHRCGEGGRCAPHQLRTAAALPRSRRRRTTAPQTLGSLHRDPDHRRNRCRGHTERRPDGRGGAGEGEPSQPPHAPRGRADRSRAHLHASANRYRQHGARCVDAVYRAIRDAAREPAHRRGCA